MSISLFVSINFTSVLHRFCYNVTFFSSRMNKFLFIDMNTFLIHHEDTYFQKLMILSTYLVQ